MPQQHSESDTLEEIIDRYSSPALSISTTLPYQRLYSSTPQHRVHGRNTSSNRPSPPLSSGEMLRRRQSSTDSGYFTRAELFGRASPAQLNSVPSSRGSERLEARRRTGHGMPDVDAMSSTLPGMSSSIEHTPSVRLSAQGLHTARAYTFSSSDVRKSLDVDAVSSKNLRNSFSGLPKDEWMQAGSPKKQMTGTGFGSGPTLKSQVSFYFPSAATTPEGKQNDGASKVVGGVRKISPAEEALRLTLSSVDASRLPAPKSRGSNWTGKLFKRPPSGSTPRSALVSRISDDNISDLGYVQPSEPRESPQAILARVRERHREAALRLSGESQADHTPGKSSDESTPFSVAVHSLTGSEDANVGDSTANDSVALSSLDPSLHTYTSSISDGQDYTSGVDATTDDATHHSLVAQISPAEESSVSPNAVTFVEFMELSQPSTLTSVHTPDSGNEMNLAPLQELGMSSIMEVINQKPIPSATPNMALAPMTELINQVPVILQSTSGLTFAPANAIVYGCVTMAAMRYALNTIGGSVRAADLALDMVLAAMIGFIICAILHFAGGGRFRRVVDRVAQLLGN